MSDRSPYLKFKTNVSGKKVKKIYLPSSFNELCDRAQSYLENIDPNKTFQIIDAKLNKRINDQNDFQTFIMEHSTENNIVILINLVDKKDINKIPAYQMENSSIYFQSNVMPKKEEKFPIKEEKKELTEEERIKENIRSLVKSKLKTLESNIYNEIIKNEQPIHNGIKCNACGTKNIKGIRYKCSTCDNYNLCENCEENSNHDENHILLKIRQPIVENELNQKISSSILFRCDFSVEPDNFTLRKNDLVNVRRFTLNNIGNVPFKKGFWFKCIKEKSTIVGNDIKIEEEIKPGESKGLDILYDKENLVCKGNEYYSSYKLIDDKSKQIGNIHKFNLTLV